MIENYLFRGLAVALILTLGAPSTFAEQGVRQDQQGLSKIKKTVADLGVNQKALVKVTLHDKNVVEGYVADIQDDAFVVRDKEHGREQTVPYSSVARIERPGNKIVEIAVGAGVVVGLMLIILYKVASNS